MARRIGLAQALINDPELIFLDEPTSGLDPIGSREIKDLILDLKRQGKTIVMCSHLLADIQDVCDRIAILDRGQLKVVGPVNELISIQDLTQITERSLPSAAVEGVKASVTSAGGQVVSVEHPTTTLEELFLKVIGKK